MSLDGTYGTALAGTDFTGQTNTSVSFAANELSKTVNVAVAHRVGFQGNRSFNVVLSGPSGAMLGAPGSAAVTIVEVDPQPSTPEEFALRIKIDYEKYGKLIRATGVKID